MNLDWTDLPKILNTLGVIMTLMGAYTVFRYAIPARNRSKGETLLDLGYPPDQSDLAEQSRFDGLALAGIWTAIFGGLLQIIATWIG